ncbi:hypothetical protein Cantr_01736 [Candida viswanathii]|uniref:Uncharacterized protein n=1 Tax=Candida viswanathii TaxID=5486 RepID=A0A367YJI6_9ASCO|nr:hypothetical protein Cantr_01736 [Candida viswanathii]
MSELFRRYKQTREAGGVGNVNGTSRRQYETRIYPTMNSLDEPAPIRRNQTRFLSSNLDKFTNSTSARDARLSTTGTGRVLKDVRFSEPPPVAERSSSRFEKYLDAKNTNSSIRDSGMFSKRDGLDRLRSPIKSLGTGSVRPRDTRDRDRLSMYSTLGSTPVRNKYKVSKSLADENLKDGRQSGLLSRLVNYFTHHEDTVEDDEDVTLLKRTARSVLDIDPVQDVLDQGYEERLRREARMREEGKVREEQERFEMMKRESARLRRRDEEEKLRLELDRLVFEERKRKEEERLCLEEERLKIEKERLGSEAERLRILENETILRLEKELSESRREVKELAREVDARKTEVSRYKTQLEEIQERYEILEQEHEDELTSLDEKNRKLMFEVKKLKDKLDAKNKENSALRSEIEEFLNLNFK